MQHPLIPHQLPALTLSILSKRYGNECEVIRFHLLLRHPLHSLCLTHHQHHLTSPPALNLATLRASEDVNDMGKHCLPQLGNAAYL